ncbi:MAG: ROK family transcriptional regulator, partial [Firmicutes bacterium]|nr:ROK family transcriptional regulator [Bacillota bacterium]
MRDIQTETAAMPKDLKVVNRMKILNAISQSERVMLNEIAETTGISRQTIVKALESFVEQQLVVSLGKGSSTSVGGKKPEIFSFNKNYKYNVCVRLENHVLIIALTNLKSEILCVKSKAHAQNEPLESIIWDFKALFAEILSEKKLSNEDIYMVGVCMGGITDAETGILRYNSLYPGWGREIPVVDMFRSILPPHIEVIVGNDAKMTGYAELYYNKELYEKSYVALYTLDGIAAGFIDHGSIIMGSHALLGEIGHMTLDPYDPEICQCGSCGCFERLVSVDRLYSKIVNNKAYESSVLYSYGSSLTLADIFRAADRDTDLLAMEMVEYVAKYFAMAIKNIMINIDPELIIIQGIYADAGKYFHHMLQKNLSRFKYFPSSGGVDITYDNREVWHLAV